ncbi:hypothetical protein JR316_0001280 [Psilocybe cubensis]|uniref:Uncharacterized protein n=2 Tax=Psilocybe cubensis TaxID=181762 RepID=A0ACB8HI36_PSICU|nr:hypothetical protein JR316_0001280 [Psilocybe cubensis]KAH9487211.1 hypothetical protein JR316_0001280 [Psilocybe cubensis]
MSTIIRLSVTGASGTGRTTLCNRLNNYSYVRSNDRHKFCFKSQEMDMDAPELLENSDAVLMALNLGTDITELAIQYAEFVHDKYWQNRKMFCIVGTKQDTMNPNSYHVAYPRMVTYWITLFTSLSSHLVGSQNGSGIDELCSAIVDKIHPIPISIGQRVLKILAPIRSWALDVIALVFSLPVPPNINKDTPDSKDLPEIPDDDVAYELTKTPESVAFNKRLASLAGLQIGLAPTHKIAPTLIAKRLDRYEKFNSIFVRAHTNIPVPQPRYLHLKDVFVTDFIPGTMLLECWDSFSIFYQFRIACTLRRYVLQMRQITSDRPGNIERGLVKGALFDIYLWNGPFRDVETFRNWIAKVAYVGCFEQHRLFCQLHPDDPPPPTPPPLYLPPDSDWKLNFTHCDLSLSNIILSEDGVLWIIDWADAGFYPSWIEARGMKRYTQAPDSWKRWLTFIAGSCSDTDFLWSHMEDTASIFATSAPREDYWPTPAHMRETN